MQDDLARRDFARSLSALVDHHRSLGVQCALAVRDRLRADQAVDFVVVSKAPHSTLVTKFSAIRAGQ
ncbi:hypothetical protein ACIQFU_04040 [Streptomyces sp. NPDC093065]|uniref:hypothetical protein n=1 Tax=Streptomyces sp. NPDC093065 TaxID=3366021 RepID=UPI00381D6B7F